MNARRRRAGPWGLEKSPPRHYCTSSVLNLIRTLRERSEPGAPPSAASLRAEDSANEE